MPDKKIASYKIEEHFRDKWRKASWTSNDDARQLEYLKLNTAERLQYFLHHGPRSSGFNQEEK